METAKSCSTRISHNRLFSGLSFKTCRVSFPCLVSRVTTACSAEQLALHSLWRRRVTTACSAVCRLRRCYRCVRSSQKYVTTACSAVCRLRPIILLHSPNLNSHNRLFSGLSFKTSEDLQKWSWMKVTTAYSAVCRLRHLLLTWSHDGSKSQPLIQRSVV